MNLFHDIPYGKEDSYFNVVIDIPYGSSNKYQYDEDGGFFYLDRSLHQQTFYNFDYGFIPQTIGGDADGIDVVMLLTHPTFPGCVIKARPIGMIVTSDQDGDDAKVIMVPITKVDPRFEEYESIDNISKHEQKELLLFFKEYKKLEEAKYPKIEIKGFDTKENTLKVIQEAVEEYKKHHAHK